MSALPSMPMPDPQTFLLPARAFLLSMRDQNIPLRQSALEDSAAHYRETPRGGHPQHIALVALIGDALQILEDLAAFADSFYSAPQGTAFFAALTHYDAQKANSFYEQIKKRPLEYYMDLLGFRRGQLVLEDAFIIDPPFTDEERAAIEEAHTGTAVLVQKHLTNLSEEWMKLLRFGHAHKHGLLVANPEDVELVDDLDDTVTFEGIVVWRRRRPGAEGYGHIPPPYDDMADYVVAMANVALDVIKHLVDSRLRIFDLIDLRADGTWTLQPLRREPWVWWFDKNDVTEESRQLLARRFDAAFA